MKTVTRGPASLSNSGADRSCDLPLPVFPAPWLPRIVDAAPVAQTVLAGLLALVCVLPTSGGRVTQADSAVSPQVRLALADGPFLSEAGLRRLKVQLGAGGRRVLDRLERPGAADAEAGPPGWGMIDLGTIPMLGLGALTGDDARLINALVPNSTLKIEPGKPFVLPEFNSTSGRRALECLTEAVYFEAGQNDDRAQAAVAQVVLNRVRHPAYPAKVCAVVYQGAMRTTGCQFSFTCDGSLQRGRMQSAWVRARATAERALKGFVMPDVGSATNYHADYVVPYWARTVVRISQVGPHIFYRWTGPLGHRSALTQKYAGNETDIAADVLASWDWRTQGIDAAVSLRQGGGSAQTDSAAAIRALQSIGLVTEVRDGRVHTFLNPVQRKPTPDEIKAINEKLAAYEKALEAPKAVEPPAPIPAAPAAP